MNTDPKTASQKEPVEQGPIDQRRETFESMGIFRITQNPAPMSSHHRALEEAAAARLLTLLTLPKRDPEYLDRYLKDTADAPAPLHFLTLLLCAGIRAAVPTLKTIPGEEYLVWEEVEAVLISSPSATERSRYVLKRWGRATRLVRRLVFRGCLLRGEVEDV